MRVLRQLQSWAPGREATSFADLSLTHQPVLFHRAFIHSRLEKWTEYDSEADDDDDSGDRRCSITGRLMFYPSTWLLCVNQTLNYLVVSRYGECTLLSLEVTPLRTEGQTFSETALNSLSPSLFPSRLFGPA